HGSGRCCRWEEQERARRSLGRRIRDTRLGNNKPLADFDWALPNRIDRAALEELMALEFVREKTQGVPFRPWLRQFRDYAFDHRAFGAYAIRPQVQACEAAGTSGWMLSSPRNHYPFAHLPR
ncbi:ATP-binding protein, partial [Caballeronia terrestris]